MVFQIPLPFKLPPVSSGKIIRLPDSTCRARQWVTEQVQRGKWRGDRSRELLPLIQRMQYDDVLIYQSWRLEFLWLDRGYPHYRLYWYRQRRYTFGIADVRMRGKSSDLSQAKQLLYVQRYLASYLVGLGFRAERVSFQCARALTPLDADTSRQYRLFRVSLKEEKQRRERRRQKSEYQLQERLRQLLHAS